MKTYYIYILAHPVTDAVFYVGSTIHPKVREAAHWSASDGTAKDEYVKSIGQKPRFTIIDEAQGFGPSDIRHIEGYWISQFRTWGFSLFNKHLLAPRLDCKRNRDFRQKREAKTNLLLTTNEIAVKMKTRTEWISEQQASDILGYKPRTLRQYVKGAKLDISYTSINGRRYKYSRSDIQKALDRNAKMIYV